MVAAPPARTGGRLLVVVGLTTVILVVEVVGAW
jgi:hypothetical protein